MVPRSACERGHLSASLSDRRKPKKTAPGRRTIQRRLKRVIRPIYLAARSRALASIEPYVFVEAHTERTFWKYVRIEPAAVRAIVIVGAWEGAEIPNLLRQYASVHIIAFEPFEASFRTLSANFGRHPRVQCYQLAIADYSGKGEFHAATLPGAGSLLPFASDLASQIHNTGLRQRSVATVAVSSLDDHEALSTRHQIDLLKIDVQGAELKVLLGAGRSLARTATVLIETARDGSAYFGAATHDEIDRTLAASGFVMCGMGLDPVTLDGNALYVRTDLRAGDHSRNSRDETASTG